MKLFNIFDKDGNQDGEGIIFTSGYIVLLRDSWGFRTHEFWYEEELNEYLEIHSLTIKYFYPE